jgi:hypothetical protein
MGEEVYVNSRTIQSIMPGKEGGSDVQFSHYAVRVKETPEEVAQRININEPNITDLVSAIREIRDQYCV